MAQPRHKKIGLALGGGGAKGIVHIGIIKALENAGIGVDYIAGTSMGALVGGWYAATKDITALENMVSEIKRDDVFPLLELLKRKDGSFFRGQTLTERLRKSLGDIEIQNCLIPFTAVATDEGRGEEVRIKKGDLVDAIRASIALPIVFAPVEFDGKMLVDGGLSNPVPANVAKEMGADYVIAVDVSSRQMIPNSSVKEIKDFYSILDRTISVIEYQLAKNLLKSADIILRPPIFSFDWLNFSRAPEIIKTGEEEVGLNLRKIRQGTGYKKPQQTFAEKFLDFILNKPN